MKALGLSKIHHINIPSTVQYINDNIFANIGIGKDGFAVIGSACKVGASNDIDIAIDINSLNLGATKKQILVHFLEEIEKFSDQVKIIWGFNIISFAQRIQNFNGRQDNEYVQVDLMFVDNLEFAKFAWHSPGDESEYKGVHRNLLLSAIAKSIRFKLLEFDKDNRGYELPAIWEKLWFDVQRGIVEGVQSRIGKTGKILKSHKTISSKVISTDPDTISKALLGDFCTVDNTYSVEEIIKVINSENFIHKNVLKTIQKRFNEALQQNSLDSVSILEE